MKILFPKNLFAFLFLIFLAHIVVAQDNLVLAEEQIQQLAKDLKYAPVDVAAPIVTDQFTSKGITHIYFQQSIDQIGIYGANASVHIKDNQVVSSNLGFLRGIEKKNINDEFQVQALEAISRLAFQKNYPLSQTELIILEADDDIPQRPTLISPAGISNRAIPLKLVFFEKGVNDLQLAWSVFIDETEEGFYKNFIINAATGTIEQEVDLTISCDFGHPAHTHENHEHENHEPSTFQHNTPNETDEILLLESNEGLANSYNVFALPIENPNFGTRSIVTSPWLANTTASPDGWHQVDGITYTTTRGNNVDAYEDSDDTDSPTGGDAARVDGGATLDFNNQWDENGTPESYVDAAITNLFYWSNIMHDVWYNYGFEEVSGNFQEDNFMRGGQGNDLVRAEAQDGFGTCNANMSTSRDGIPARMQMFNCGNRDGSVDNGVIAHEYGHGISKRLVGGPSNSSCLNNQEQMGEGWSDFFALMMTIKDEDIATTKRTVGTWLFGQDATGAGLRPYPYTTNMTDNPMTYGYIDNVGISIPHGLGAVWATMLWDLNWAMIDRHGWDADLYNGNGGNNMTMALVIEGLKLQPCSPGFVDGRDAILAADRLLYGGGNQCLIWQVFARRGLGFSANQGSPSMVGDEAEAFDMPPSCIISLTKTTDKADARLGENISFELSATNNKGVVIENLILQDILPANLEFVSATNGGTANGQIVSWPSLDLSVGQTVTETIVAKVRENAVQAAPNFIDDLENGMDNWRSVTDNGDAFWNYQSAAASSGTYAFHCPGTQPASVTNLLSVNGFNLTDQSELIFQHLFDIEENSSSTLGWDAGVVEISLDNGATWDDLESKFTQNGYNRPIAYNFNGFSGNSNGWIESKVDLSSYAGQRALIRFQMRYDGSFFRPGWYIDDIQVTNLNTLVFNQVRISNADIAITASVNQPTNIIFDASLCTENIASDFNTNDITSDDYRVAGDLVSSGIVKPGSVVNFYAGNSIVLNPGFEAQLGSDFLATIEECRSITIANIEQSPQVNATQRSLTEDLNDLREREDYLSIRPNPFSSHTTVHFELATKSQVWIGLFDITGKLIREIQAASIMEAGAYQIVLQSDFLENGAYWISMQSEAGIITKKIFLIKD